MLYCQLSLLPVFACNRTTGMPLPPVSVTQSRPPGSSAYPWRAGAAAARWNAMRLPALMPSSAIVMIPVIPVRNLCITFFESRHEDRTHPSVARMKNCVLQRIPAARQFLLRIQHEDTILVIFQEH